MIYSGGNDTVTLDLGTTTINSLTLGGVSNGFTSELTDGGTAQTLNITNALNVGQNGQLIVNGGSSLTAGTLTNTGSFLINNSGTTVSVNGNALNTGYLALGDKLRERRGHPEH